MLFGGTASMVFVHRLFSIDSRFWLDHHAGNATPTQTLVASIVLLRRFLTSFGIVDWEDLGVWEKVRDRTGRSIGDKSAVSATRTIVGPDLVELWNAP